MNSINNLFAGKTELLQLSPNHDTSETVIHLDPTD